MRSSPWAWPLAAIALVIGCTSDEGRFHQDLEAVVAPSQAGLRTSLEAVRAAIAVARAHPPIQPIALPPGAPPIDARELVDLRHNPACNAVAVLEDEPLDTPLPDETARSRAGFFPMSAAGRSFALLGSYRPAFDPYQHDFVLQQVRDDVQRATATRYVVACRTVSFTRLPTTTAYTPSQYQGECRVVDVHGPTYLGGVAISAATHETETVWIGGTAGSANSQLYERMRDQMVQQLDAALTPLGSPAHAVWLGWSG